MLFYMCCGVLNIGGTSLTVRVPHLSRLREVNTGFVLFGTLKTTNAMPSEATATDVNFRVA